MQKMEFLGHTLSDKGLRPSDEKIKAISQISAPVTKKVSNINNLKLLV